MRPGFMSVSGHDPYAMLEDSRLELPCVRGSYENDYQYWRKVGVPMNATWMIWR